MTYAPLDITEKGIDRAAGQLTQATNAPFGIQNLPPELKVAFFRELSASEALMVSTVCREWYMIANDDHLWNFFLRRDLQMSDLESPKELYRKAAFTTPPNLTKGIYSMTQIRESDFNMEYYRCDGEELAVDKERYNIKIRNFEGGVRKRSLPASLNLKAILTDQGDLIIGCEDGKIKIFDMKSRICKKTMTESTSKVHSLVLTDDEQLVSGHDDGSIKIWNLETGNCIRTIDGGKCVASICLTKGGELISGDMGGPTKIWDLTTGACVRTLEGCDCVYSLCLTNGEKLILGHYTGLIKVVDLQTGHCETTFSLFARTESLALTNDQKIIVDNGDHSFFCILDFRASNNEIFEELATVFDKFPVQQHPLAIERFLRMPTEERAQIYVELYKILSSQEGGFSGSAEHAFHNVGGLNSTPQQQALAIRNYLRNVKQ